MSAAQMCERYQWTHAQYAVLIHQRYQWTRDELGKARVHLDAGRISRAEAHLSAAREWRKSAREWRATAKVMAKARALANGERRVGA